MFDLIREDLNHFSHGPSLRDKMKVILLSPGFTAVILIRVQEFFYRKHLLIISYLTHRMNLTLHGIDVLPGVSIGGGLRIEHPSGIVIGAGSSIGNKCTIMQGVTLGVRNVMRDINNNKFPIVGNGVFIGANSSILGGIVIGDNVIIGAHSLVLINCPTNSRFIGELRQID